MIDRLNAALVGRYRVERELGEGGMATVYLAEDVKHRRQVALKVLRPELAAVVGGERFLAEIETTANLQHPQILPLYDSGAADPFLFYVMPYVEGESLRELLDRERQLPVEQAVRIARAVASGLDYAHRHGVVHRDIKPANILLQDGQPVIADFGIALAVQQAGGGRLTETGLSLGTPYYMSPEQATAERDPGPRSDVYSLGCVLYEMLTGDPPFTGSTAQSVLGKILTGEPARPRDLRSTVPPHVEAAVLKALQKVPADRFRSAADFARALEAPVAAGVDAGGATVPATGRGRPPVLARSRVWGPWIVAGTALAALAAVMLPGGRGAGSGAGAAGDGGSLRLRATLELPANAAITEANVAIARDGHEVIVTGSWDGQSMLLRRRLDGAEFTPLPGSEGGGNAFLSPDGRWVAYRGGGGMRRLPLAGGPPGVMDPDGNWAGGDWAEDGTVVYSRNYLSGLWLMQAEGGEPEELTRPGDGELAHWWPRFLPDGEHVLFTAFRTPVEQARIAVVSVRTGERKDVLQGGVFGRYVPTGHLLFARGEAIYAVPFDPVALEVTGDAVPVVQDVAMSHVDGVAAFDLSDDGTLVYVPASDYNAPSDLVWVTRDGRETPVVPDADRYANPSLSPDGRAVAVAVSGAGEAPDIWVLDLVRGTRSRFTARGGADFAPVWTPSGDRLVYVAERPTFDLFSRPADRSAPPAPLVVDSVDRYPGSFTPAGDTLLFEEHREHIGAWKVPVTGGEPRPVFAPDFNVYSPAVSPDGRWLAYASDESGRKQVFLSPYAEPDRLRRQVSGEGGESPRWTRDGRELVYRDGGRVLAVSVEPATGELGRPEVLFEGPYQYSPDGNAYNYEITPDGERFLMVSRPPERAPRRVMIVTRFFDTLRTLDAAGR